MPLGVAAETGAHAGAIGHRDVRGALPRRPAAPCDDARVELRRACRAVGIGVVTAGEHDGPDRVHRAVPALSTRLVVSLGAPLEFHYDGAVHTARAVVTGLMRPGVATPATALRSRQPVVYAELAPAALQRLIGVPLRDVDAGGLAADAVLPWVNALCEELAGRPVGDRVHVMRVRLLERLVGTDRAAGPDDAFRTLGRIRAGGGTVPVSTLAGEAHLSPRRLREVMRRSLGVTPKFASRVARLASAVERAAAGADSWTTVAADSGYHDQSHLVHDFRDLMDTTPTAWLGEEGRNLQGWWPPRP
ncbi:putative transcriptional regulator [Nocardia farcinica IFM 10152]|uniref:Putative transcriptional regulator n=1 Tax=Nocardia farcinica (strain IFM 10152) TaxID=247156 RepID=Q5YZ94_NOCFA|nr:putative transcriptional regulator [Nocardia farcinica IFM 10152]